MKARIATLVCLLGCSAAACEQYHPTAPDHIRPASDEDRRFAAKVGEERKSKRIINDVEDRAGPVLQPMLEKRAGLELWRLSITGPVGVAEGLLDGRLFAGVYWVRDGKAIKRREFVGASPADPSDFAIASGKRLRAAGDAEQLRVAKAIIAGKAELPATIVFRDAHAGTVDGGRSALQATIAEIGPVVDAWSVGKVAVILTEAELWVFRFDAEVVTFATRYSG